MLQFSDKYIQQLFRAIYTGKVTQRVLPEMLYMATADYMKRALYLGYGTTWTALKSKNIPSGFSTRDVELMGELRTNIYLFSAAKTYQQIRDMSSALIDDKGTIVPFKQFREKADQTYNLYNKVWLQTEYNTAIGQAQNARKWVEIEKNADVLPYLEYSAVIDKRTSEICRPLDGIIARVDDPIWKKVTPLNHFNCRCLLIQLSDAVPTNPGERSRKVEEAENMMEDLFKMNSGQDGYIFSKDHPYFDVAPKDKALARRNFDLPIPKKDKPSEADVVAPPPPPTFKPAKSIKEAEKWATDNGIAKSVKYSGISLENANGINKTLKQVFDDFNIDPLKEIKGGARSLGLGNGEMIQFNKSMTVPEETKKQFFNGVTNYRTKNLARLKAAQDGLANPEISLGQRAMYRAQEKEAKAALDFNRWSVHISEEHVVEDLFIHEAGHVIEDQLLGQINRILVQPRFGKRNPATRLMEFERETEKMRQEWLSVHRALTKDDLSKISRYGATNLHEVFAESLVMYYREPQNMPPTIKAFFDKLKAYARRN